MIDKETYDLVVDLVVECKAAQEDTYVDNTQTVINRAEDWLLSHKREE